MIQIEVFSEIGTVVAENPKWCPRSNTPLFADQKAAAQFMDKNCPNMKSVKYGESFNTRKFYHGATYYRMARVAA
jgi:hypothetical protein